VVKEHPLVAEFSNFFGGKRGLFVFLIKITSFPLLFYSLKGMLLPLSSSFFCAELVDINTISTAEL